MATEVAMRFGAALWTNRTSWPDLRDACLAAETAGWDSLWIDDHLLPDESDATDPKLEGWAVLSALAVLTGRARLGLLVAANTFRNPALNAKLATTVDHLSCGRLVLGLGGGWFEREHEAFGLDFGSGFGERLDRLDEAVGIIRRLLDGETVTHDGRFYSMRGAVCAPRPVQARLPILIGGSGPTKTLRTTARYADLWNGFGPPERVAQTSEIHDGRPRTSSGSGTASVRWRVPTRPKAVRHNQCASSASSTAANQRARAMKSAARGIRPRLASQIRGGRSP